MAAQRGRLLSVRSLLRHPATDPNRPNPAVQGGDTPLHIAARSGKSKVVRALLADDRINTCVLNAAGTSPAAAAKDVRRLDGSLKNFWVRVHSRSAERSAMRHACVVDENLLLQAAPSYTHVALRCRHPANHTLKPPVSPSAVPRVHRRLSATQNHRRIASLTTHHGWKRRGGLCGRTQAGQEEMVELILQRAPSGYEGMSSADAGPYDPFRGAKFRGTEIKYPEQAPAPPEGGFRLPAPSEERCVLCPHGLLHPALCAHDVVQPCALSFPASRPAQHSVAYRSQVPH